MEDKNIIVEKLSGKAFRRPGYQQLVRSLRTGDVLVVQSVDRLGRNYDEILKQWSVITKEVQFLRGRSWSGPVGNAGSTGSRLNKMQRIHLADEPVEKVPCSFPVGCAAQDRITKEALYG